MWSNRAHADHGIVDWIDRYSMLLYPIPIRQGVVYEQEDREGRVAVGRPERRCRLRRGDAVRGHSHPGQRSDAVHPDSGHHRGDA